MMRWLRVLLWLLAALLLAALVWWGGPELRIGDSRPLDPAATRLALIAAIPLLFLLPLLGGALAWSWRQLGGLQRAPAADASRAACTDLLAHLQANAPRGTGWRAQARLWLRRRWPGFAPDVLVVAEPGKAQALQRLWPGDMDGAIGHPEAGDGFWSGGRCWLVLPPQALAAWAPVLRWRRAVRTVLWLLDAGTELPGRGARPALLDEARVQLAGLRRRSRRQCALWLLLWNEGGADLQPAWTGSGETLPRGFILPLRAPLDARSWQPLVARLRQLLQAAVRSPEADADAAQARLTLLHRCTDQAAAAPVALRQMAGGDGAFAVARPRAVFWCWAGAHACIGLDGLLGAIAADRPPLRRTAVWALVHGLGLLAVAAAVAALALQVSWLRPADHGLALQHWRARLPEIRALAGEAAAAGAAGGQAQGEQALALAAAVDGLQSTAQADTGEALPEPAAARMATLAAQLWRQRLQPGLLAWNRQCLAAKTPARPAAAPAPADLYRSLATALMLQGRLAPDEAGLRSALLACDATPEQADAAAHLLLQAARLPAAMATTTAGADGPGSDTAAWRTQLRGAAHWSLEERVWQGLSHEVGPADAHDFELAGALGPAASWFAAGPSVPWLYTGEGLRLGYHAATGRYEAWAREYAAVMDEPQALPRHELEALADRLRVRYVREAAAAWEGLFDRTTLAPVQGLAEAAERAQVFGSDTSPFIQLLDVLEQRMPLPPRKNLSLWWRLRQRAAQDWARLQYELGWRSTPRAPLPLNDPAFALAQNFGLLRSYFADVQGKSPARERLLQTIQALGRYLTQKQAAEEFGSRTPPSTSLSMLRVQAQRLPAPLRQLVNAIAVSTGQQVHQEQAQKLALDLEAIDTWRACRLDPSFPLRWDATAELPWESFVEDLSPQGRVARTVEASAELIDTSGRQWRLRLPQQVQADARTTAELQWLQRATRLTRAWFPGGPAGLELRLQPLFLDSSLLEARLMVGGQEWRYSHGAVTETAVRWPGPSGSREVELELRPVLGPPVLRRYSGPWALLQLAREARVQTGADPSQLVLELGAEGAALRLGVTASGEFNPLDARLYAALCAPPPARTARAGRP